MPIPKNELVGLRIRVERLLKGDKRPEDVAALFLALRDYSGGRECVTEIGNFVAHRGERNVGITTREARDFFSTVQFYTDCVHRNRPINLFDLPKNISSLLEGSFRRTPNDMIRRHLSMNRQTAERRLSELRSRLYSDAQGKVILKWPTDLDQAILGCLLGHVTARPAFTDQHLIEQFTESLAANGLIQKSELKTFKSLREFVGLFAVANMHLCVIDLGDGTAAELAAGATKSQGVIGVTASAEMKGINLTGTVRVATTFFKTLISVFDCADPDLHPQSDQEPTWPYHIELTASGKLVIPTA
jgi:hypothetical protein